MNCAGRSGSMVLPLLAFLAACGGDGDGGTPPPPPPDKADLVIAAIGFTPEEPLPSEEVSALVTVQNVGTAPAWASVLRVEVDGSEACGTVAVDTLAGGNAAQVQCELGLRDSGPHQVSACADAANELVEGSEQNNCATVTLNVRPPGVPGADLLIETIDVLPPEPQETEPIQIRVTLRNVGNRAAAASATGLSLDDVVACAEIATPPIPAGEATTVNCDLEERPAGVYVIRACADVQNVVVELNELHNCGTDTLRVGP